MHLQEYIHGQEFDPKAMFFYIIYVSSDGECKLCFPRNVYFPAAI